MKFTLLNGVYTVVCMIFCGVDIGYGIESFINKRYIQFGIEVALALYFACYGIKHIFLIGG